MKDSHHFDQLRQFQLDVHGERLGHVHHRADQFVVARYEVVVEALRVHISIGCKEKLIIKYSRIIEHIFKVAQVFRWRFYGESFERDNILCRRRGRRAVRYQCNIYKQLSHYQSYVIQLGSLIYIKRHRFNVKPGHNGGMSSASVRSTSLELTSD